MISAFSTWAQLRQMNLGRKAGGNDRSVRNPVTGNPVTGGGFGALNPSAAASTPLGSIGMAGAVAPPVTGPNGDFGGAFSPNIYISSKGFSNQSATANSAFTPSPMGGALLLERNKPVEISQQRPIDTSAYQPTQFSGGLV